MPSAPSGPLSVPAWMTPHNLLRASVGVALLTIVLKTLAWWVSGSVGLLSDALESFVNLAGAMFALAMVTIARRPADEDHPYGHHKAEYFSSGFEGILIVGASIAILWAAVLRLMHPQPLEQLGWGMGLSLLSTACNGLLAWGMLRAAQVHRSLALEGDARHLMTDVWTSIGVVGGLLAAGATGWLWLDPLVAIAVALNILREGGALIWRASQGLMDEAMEPGLLARVFTVLGEHNHASAGVVYFDSLTSRRAGARNYVDLHMHVPAHWTLGHAAEQRTAVEQALMQAVPGLRATIELLPEGQATVFETAEAAAPGGAGT
ncbi:MAG: cation transporter [Acidovorax sp.]|uniref:Cation diffusion facilitator family transporter n=2 Tax=Diaphorobacter TaxID=238749 RepID=A0A9J9Q4U0_ACIET|nr:MULTISPECIES: cation diffusion facilitator family transporter [Diaphorobacter]ACM31969.1 cation diffusion facilitator family transporter [[Acidovorax] ebreus TPSY]PZU41502.1 MAG: cation transporter [Acidovorax sp.]QJY34448.1 cation transporter [Diaphorobacter sp. JS3050]